MKIVVDKIYACPVRAYDDQGTDSTTVLWIDPENRRCGIRQELPEEKCWITEEEQDWIFIPLDCEVIAREAREYLEAEEAQKLLRKICSKRFYNDAESKKTLEEDMEELGMDVVTMDIEFYLEEVARGLTPETTDDELISLAKLCNEEEKRERIQLIGDALTYLKECRDNLREEAEE
jgi:hypothetical protein